MLLQNRSFKQCRTFSERKGVKEPPGDRSGEHPLPGSGNVMRIPRSSSLGYGAAMASFFVLR
jgi:hypothetical protein